MNAPVLDLTKRRSQYALGKNLSASKEEIAALIRESVKLAPSAFNSQSTRVVVLFGEESDKVWNIAKDELRKIVPADAFPQTEAKLNSFAAGVGTVLFYEDQKVVKGLQENFALYADRFPVWSEHASAMAQLAVWTALATKEIGASLQHYNPIIDAEVAKTWDIPGDWKLIAQMPFGSNEGVPGEKAFIADGDRFKFFG